MVYGVRTVRHPGSNPGLMVASDNGMASPGGTG